MSSAADIDTNRKAMLLALDAVEEARCALLAGLGDEVEASGDVIEPHQATETVRPEDIPDISDTERWLSIKDTARRGRVVYETVQDWISNGTVVAVRCGRSVYVDFTTVPIRRIVPKPPRTS